MSVPTGDGRYTVSVIWQFALVYLNDTDVFLRVPRDSLYHVKQVPSFLQEAGVTLKLEMCIFFTGIFE